MAWLIVAEDRPEAAHLRRDAALMARMWQWELDHRDRILAAGSLRDDGGRVAQGSLLILDCATKDEALALFTTDPATVAGLRGVISVRYWNPAILGGQALD